MGRTYKTFLDETLELVEKSDLPITVICKGAQVSTRWYHKLIKGDIRDPGVKRIQRLYDYLVQNPEPEDASV